MSGEQWREAAMAGDPIAQCNRARALLAGPRADDAWREAFGLIEKACESGSPDAHMLQSIFAVHGLGRPQDLREALGLMRRAAELGSKDAAAQLSVLAACEGFDTIESWLQPTHQRQLFNAPRLSLVARLIPKRACAWLIEKSRPRLQKSNVYTPGQGLSENSVRTSSEIGFSALEPDIVLHLINVRIAHAVGGALANFEHSRVLRYAVGEEFKPHFDAEEGKLDELRARPGETVVRVATLLLYLNAEYEGGETAFPKLEWMAKGGPGDAILFWSYSAQGAFERNSLHSGRPVTKGEKWLLSKWLRDRPSPLA